MGFAVGEDREVGQVPVMIQQQMQFHRALGMAEMRSVVEFQAQINDTGIQTDQLE